MPISVITFMSSFGAFGIWPPALCFDAGGFDYFSLIEKNGLVLYKRTNQTQRISPNHHKRGDYDL